MKLWRAPYSTNCERVTLALAYKGLEAEPAWIDYSDRSAVEAVSGQGLVPVLEDGDTVVADSTRILEHLESRFPDPPLYPADAARRAETEVFIDWFNRVWKLAPNAFEAEPDPVHTEAMSEHLDLFERLLAGRDYLMGDELSAADLVAYPFLKYAAGRDPEDDEPFHVILDDHQSLQGRPRLAAWINRVNSPLND